MKRSLPILLLLFGCHENAQLPAPPVGEAASAIVWSYADDEARPIQVSAIDGDGRFDPPIPAFFFQDRLETFMMTYACPAEDLGLPLGGLALLDPIDDHEENRLPQEMETLFLALDGIDDQPEWRSLEERDPRATDTLRRTMLPADHICSRYRTPLQSTPLTISEQPAILNSFAVAVPPDRLWVGFRTGRIFEVSPSGAYSEVTDLGLPEAPAEIEFRGAFARGETIYLYAPDGRVASGTASGGFSFLPAVSTATGADVALTGSPPDQPLELFAITNQRKMARYDGTSWEVVFEGSEVPICDLGATRFVMWPSVTWIGPEEAIGLGAGEAESTLVRYRQGQAFEEGFPTFVGNPISVTNTPVGLFAGTCRGELMTRDEGTWRTVAPNASPSSLPLVALSSLPHSTLYGSGSFGGGINWHVVEAHPQSGYCLAEGLSQIGYTRFMVRSGPHIYVVAFDLDAGVPQRITVITPGEQTCFATKT